MRGIQKYVIATDCDEVLVNTNGKWIRSILSDADIMSKVPRHAVENAVKSHPMNREEFDITSHFKTHDGSWLTPELKQKMLDKYFLDPYFYDDLNQSIYVNALKGMIDMGVIESIWVITSCMDLKYPVTASKVRFLDKVFNEVKLTVPVHYVFTEKGEKKSDAIKAKGINYHSFVDDHISNIEDVIQNTDSKEREFLIPRYRYNIDFPNAAHHTTTKDVNIIWFDNDMVLHDDGLLYDRVHNHKNFDRFPLNWSK
jgi:hypothetical protein